VAVQRALSTAAIAVTATMPVASQAQGKLEEVVVTGSRIAVDPNLGSTSPVTQIKAEDIGYRGITRVEDLLNDLPQIFGSNTSNESNGATGTATIDLRGLTPARTLVLTNGHRMGFGDVFELAPDINQIPAALIERVEVLTGGASSTYGSDAVAGVVNFIMKRDFEGIEANYQYSFYQHNQGNNDVQDAVDAAGFVQSDDSVADGDTHNVDLVVGVNSPDGKGNITAYLSYRNVDEIFQADRDFSSCALLGIEDATICGGSSTIPQTRVTDFATFDFMVDGTNFVDRNGLLYNYGPLNYFQRPDERYTAGAFAHYEINEHAELYSEFMFMDDRSLAQIAPSGAFFVTNTLNCDNPFLSAQQAAAVGCTPGTVLTGVYIGRRNVEGGPRFDDLGHTSYRILAGVKGNINDDWSYDAFANFSRTERNEVYQNDMSTTRIIRALDVVAGPGGAPTCQSVIDGSDPNCVPWNIFQEGGVTQEAIDYLTLPLFSKGDIKQDQYVAFVTGDLTSMGIKSPAANDGVSIVLGGEYRDERMEFNPDQNYQSGDGAGQGGPIPAVEGGVQVGEFFMETKIPLIQDREWFKSLTFEAGYRYSDYDTGVNTDTYKFGGEWTPQDGYKFRGGYSRAVRAANINELFSPQALGLFAGNDPCAGPTPAATAAQCANSGVTAAQYGTVPGNPAQQYNTVGGGNPDLDPEKADSYSVGAVFTPDFVPGLQFSVDYWSISVDQAISAIDPQVILDGCVFTGDPTFCALINRGPNGNLWIGQANVLSTSINIGSIETAGIDFAGAYTYDIGNYGKLDFAFVGTYLDKYDLVPLPDSPTVHCAGKWGGACDIGAAAASAGSPVFPEWRHNFSLTWTTPWDLTFSGTWRHVGSVDDEAGARFNPDSENYLDLAAVYKPSFINFGQTQITMGVTNVTDNDPPVSGFFAEVGTFGNGNTIPATWDAMGRYFFFAVKQSF
jgi:outer membrane receptor protein involved in Fe transport